MLIFNIHRELSDCDLTELEEGTFANMVHLERMWVSNRWQAESVLKLTPKCLHKQINRDYTCFKDGATMLYLI